MLGLGLSLTTGGVATPAYVALAKAFVTRVEADGGTVESFACLKTDMAYLTSNPAAPAGYTAEWSAATVGSSAEFRINLVGGAGYTYTYAVTDSQATEVTGTGVMGGNIQAVTADLSTLVDGTVTLAVYLTGAGGDGLVVTDTATLVGYTGLLDTYSGAAAAYSLRLLDTSYTGDAIVVRRASDNTTQNIGFVNNELDTASLESFCSGTNGFVTTWYDQSGNGNDAANATASAQPQIVSSGSTILENGKPAILSDEDYLENLTKTASSTATLFMVHKGNSDGATNASVVGFPANTYNAHIGLYFWEQDSADPFGFNIWQGDSWGYANAKTDFDSQSLWTGLFKEGNITTSGVKLFRNGSEKTLLQARGSSSVNRIIDDGVYIGRGGTIGNNQEGDGWYQEIVIWDADYSSTNRTGIETNINDFYSIY